MSASTQSMYTKPFVLTTLAFFCFFTNVNAYNLLPLYLQALGAQTGEIGTIMATFSVAAILAQAITGRLLDRGWRKPCLLAAAALLTAVSAAFGLTTQLGWPLYVLRFLQGLSFAVYMTSSMTLIADLAPPTRRAEAVGIYGTGGLVAVALGPAVGELILGAGGFPAFFAATVGVAAATVTLAALVPVPPITPAPRGPRLGWEGWVPFLPVLLPASSRAREAGGLDPRTRFASGRSHPRSQPTAAHLSNLRGTRLRSVSSFLPAVAVTPDVIRWCGRILLPALTVDGQSG